jgi:mono/diheme cytochrome c family protein
MPATTNQTAVKGASVRRKLFVVSICAGLVLPASTAQAQDTAPFDPKKVEAGLDAYTTYCYTCHGENLVSGGNSFDLRRLQPADRARFESSVTNGKGQMPPWRGVIAPEEIDAIWNYIMSMRKH